MEDAKASKQSFDSSFYSTWDTDRFWEVIASAEELSLLQSISPVTGWEGASLFLHSLIRDWLQLRLETKDRQKYTYEAITVLACCVSEYNVCPATLKEKTALITHMKVSLSNDQEFSEPPDRLGRNIANCDNASGFANFYFHQGRYRTSEKLYRLVLEVRKSQLSEKNSDTLRIMNDLALVLDSQSNYKEVERMFRQTSELNLIVFEEKDPRTLMIMTSLAHVLNNQKKYEEVGQLNRQTLIFKQEILGKDHPDTLISMNSLAEVLRIRNQYKEAEQLHRQILTLRERVLGKEHSSTLVSVNNLAAVLYDQNQYEKAERLCRQTLTLRETVLGKEHPETLMSIEDLAIVLSSQGRDAEAERLDLSNAT